MRCGLEQLADRQVPALQPGLVLNNLGLFRVGIPGTGGVLRYGPPDPDGRATDVGSISDSELSNGTEMSLAVKGADAPVCDRHRVENRRQPYLLDAGNGLVNTEVAVSDFFDERPEACAAQGSAESRQLRQLGQRLSIGEEGPQARLKLGNRQLLQACGARPPGHGLHLGAELPEGTFGVSQVGRQMRPPPSTAAWRQAAACAAAATTAACSSADLGLPARHRLSAVLRARR